MRARSRAARLGLTMALAFAVASGCMHRQRDEVFAAREARDRCVEARGAAHPECQVLEERLLALERRYEQEARTGWGCDPSLGECPNRR